MLWWGLILGALALADPGAEEAPEEIPVEQAGRQAGETVQGWGPSDWASILGALLGVGGLGGVGLRYGPGLLATRRRDEDADDRPVMVVPDIDRDELEALAQRSATEALHRAMEQVGALRAEIEALKKVATTPAQAVDIARQEATRIVREQRQAARVGELAQEVALLRAAVSHSAPTADLLREVHRLLCEIRGGP
jgi:CBS-domain-containing membrane protein